MGSSTQTFLKLLDFEVRLIRTIESDNGGNVRRLDSDVGAIRRWFQRRMSSTTTTTASNNNNNDSITTSSQPQHQQQQQQQRRNDEITVDPSALKEALREYLFEFLKMQLLNSTKANYAAPFQVILYPIPNNRHNRALGSLEYDVDNNKLLEEDDVMYQGFDNDESGFERIEMNGIFNSNLETEGTNGGGIEFEEDTLSLLSTTSSLLSHDPTPNQHYLRHQSTTTTNNSRRTETRNYYYSRNFGGSVQFKDPSPPNTDVIPRDATVQAMQATALADQEDVIVKRLRDYTNPPTRPNPTGLTSTTGVTIGFVISSGGPQVPTGNIPTSSPANGTNNGFDVIIFIAIAVAACSMMLLAFALFLAFRRRKQRRDGQTKEIGSPRNEKSTKKSSVGTRSPLNNSAPPVFEIMENDDNISEYTESVYSMPVAMGVGDPRVEGQCGASTKGVERSGGALSTRFSPRYVGSQAVEELSRESSEDVNDLDGITPGHGDGHVLNMLPVSLDATDQTTTAPVLKDTVLKQLGIDIDHDALIDRDIHSSLEAYGNGAFADPDGEQNDVLSLSSAETYGFSLDGMNSTVANSTKYGY